uniref:Uncharacterized protein n=1 Tax=Arundo donax TaxID=35708 RepID=A0A0A9D0L9_ARUDO
MAAADVCPSSTFFPLFAIWPLPQACAWKRSMVRSNLLLNGWWIYL